MKKVKVLPCKRLELRRKTWKNETTKANAYKTILLLEVLGEY
jgi:hypothetical protein